MRPIVMIWCATGRLFDQTIAGERVQTVVKGPDRGRPAYGVRRNIGPRARLRERVAKSVPTCFRSARPMVKSTSLVERELGSLKAG